MIGKVETVFDLPKSQKIGRVIPVILHFLSNLIMLSEKKAMCHTLRFLANALLSRSDTFGYPDGALGYPDNVWCSWLSG